MERSPKQEYLRVGLETVGINPVLFRPDFYILPTHFRIFGQIWNLYEIRDVKFKNGTETVWLISRTFSYFPYFIGISLFTNLVYRYYYYVYGYGYEFVKSSI